MANKRNLKKDVRYLTEIVVIEAIELSEIVTNEESKRKALTVIIEVAELYNNLIARINHPDAKENPTLVKKYYKSIIDDLISGCNKAFDDLNKVTL